MKIRYIFNKIINKIGVDKMLHFGVGAIFAFIVLSIPIIVSYFSDAQIGAFVGYYAASIFVSGILTFIAAVTKEIIDEVGDRKDVFATMLGWFSVSVFYSVMILFVAL